MILTDYYKFIRPDKKTKYRFDCVCSTKSYHPFEALKGSNGLLSVYITPNKHTKAGKQGKSDLALSKNHSISSLYRPDLENNLAFGDVQSDALVFVLNNFTLSESGVSEDAVVEVFVARGYKRDCQSVYTAFADGGLSNEVEELRGKANFIHNRGETNRVLKVKETGNVL
jgi:hypothetical protein